MKKGRQVSEVEMIQFLFSVFPPIHSSKGQNMLTKMYQRWEYLGMGNNSNSNIMIALTYFRGVEVKTVFQESSQRNKISFCVIGRLLRALCCLFFKENYFILKPGYCKWDKVLALHPTPSSQNPLSGRDTPQYRAGNNI